MSTLSFTRRVLREQPLRFPLVAVGYGVVGLIEGLGVAAIVPLLSLVTGEAAVGSAGAVERLVRGLISALGVRFDLASVLVMILALVLAQQAALLAQQKLALGSIYKFEADLRERLYGKIMKAGWPFFVREKTATIVNALTVEASRGGVAYEYLNIMLGNMSVALIYSVLAVVLSWQMALGAAAVGLSVAALLRRRVSRGARFGQAVTNTNAELSGEALEHISGAKLVKGSAGEGFALTRFRRQVHRLASEQYRAGMNRTWLKITYDGISASAVLVGVYAAVTWFSMPLSSLIVFLLIFYRLTPRLSNLQTLQHNVLSFLPALEVIDSLCERADGLAEQTGGETPPAFTRALEFDDVSFSWPSAGVSPILAHVGLSIEPGTIAAFVGPSGAGKTTLVDVIMGLLRPTEGDIRIDGIRLGVIDLHEWRKRIGYVGQDAVFFHASIFDNLTWAHPEATMDDVMRACAAANAREFIDELPESYDSVIGDRGVRLSGGQRQRIALARALVGRPDILILDEATSALDAESEEKILDAVRELGDSVTVIMVSHRLALVKDADVIYFLEDGRIAEWGSWAELTLSAGRFEELRRLQELA